MAKSKLYNMFLVLVGVVAGTLAGNLCSSVKGLSWLAFGLVFGMETPLTLNLGIMELTFALSINLTLAVIIFIIIAIIVGRAIVK